MKKVSYKYNETVNFREMEKVSGAFYNDLKGAYFGQLSRAESEEYCIELCRSARSLYDPEELFLPLTRTCDMPSDARVNLIYMPTYIGTAFIMLAAVNYPEIMDKPEIRKTLAKLLKGCTGRGLEGHGYEAQEGMIDAMEVFSYAKSGAFIKRYPKLCPEFTKLYKEKIKITDKLAGGELSIEESDEDKRTEKIKRVKAIVCAYTESRSC